MPNTPGSGCQIKSVVRILLFSSPVPEPPIWLLTISNLLGVECFSSFFQRKQKFNEYCECYTIERGLSGSYKILRKLSNFSCWLSDKVFSEKLQLINKTTIQPKKSSKAGWLSTGEIRCGMKFEAYHTSQVKLCYNTRRPVELYPKAPLEGLRLFLNMW